ncbi:MAG: methionine biosynthesis protein MetW [Chloroflexi bacterium RBG_16_57_8]|nr:MAG: methionine biosynthesis protein MetW [Chloroflexi bacterium RBG_16_57_8]
MKSDQTRLDNKFILDMVRPGSSVLDLGCGEGELLSVLLREKQCRVQGIEIDEQAVYKCVARGVSVLQGDADSDLPDYGDRSFDYVVLSQSFQQVKKPDTVLREALRVGKEVIVSFPNFANLSARWQMFFKGTTPVTPSLPYEWHDTPNLHFLSITDFIVYCRKRHIKIKKAAFTGKTRRVTAFPNVFAQTGIFLLSNGEGL